MKAQVRMRKYGNEWLAWYRVFQGEHKPLAAEHPLAEIKIAESMDKLQTMYERHFPAAMPLFKVIGFMACELHERAKIVVKDGMFEQGGVLYHQNAATIELDTLYVDVMDDAFQWQSMELACVNGMWHDITGKVKKGFLLEEQG